MVFRKYVLSIAILLVLFITSSCNEDKKFVEKGKESLKDGKQEQALVYFDKALEINPKNKEALIGKGKILSSKLESTGEAEICFDKVLKIDPENPEAWNGKGMSFYIQQKNKEALDCFDTALSKDPNNIDSLKGKILVFETQGNIEDVMTCYKKILQLINPIEGNTLKENILAFLYKYGKELYDNQKYEEAMICCDKAFELDPENTVYLSSKGWCLYRQGKKEEAIKCFDKILETKPEETYTWIEKGYVLASQSIETFPKEAEECFKKYNSKKQSEGKLKSFYENPLEVLDLIKKAKESFKEADPLGYVMKHNYYHNEHYQNKDYLNESLEYSSKIIKADPFYLSGWVNTGISLLALKQYKEAEESFDTALKLNSFYIIWYLKGRALYEEGKKDEVVECCNEALKQNPKYINALLLKGYMLFYSFRKYNEALECFNMVLKVDPNNEKGKIDKDNIELMIKIKQETNINKVNLSDELIYGSVLLVF